MRVVLASDKVGAKLKDLLVEHVTRLGQDSVDLGAADDYPVAAERAARQVAAGEADRAILCCGGGVGMAIVANKIDGIRAASCTEPWTARLGREHQDINVMALGAGGIGPESARMCAEQFLAVGCEGGVFTPRLEMIERLEKGETLR